MKKLHGSLGVSSKGQTLVGGGFTARFPTHSFSLPRLPVDPQLLATAGLVHAHEIDGKAVGGSNGADGHGECIGGIRVRRKRFGSHFLHLTEG